MLKIVKMAWRNRIFTVSKYLHEKYLLIIIYTLTYTHTHIYNFTLEKPGRHYFNQVINVTITGKGISCTPDKHVMKKTASPL